MCNKREMAALPAITVLRFEKNRSSGNVQKRKNFGITLNVGPAFSDRFQVPQVFKITACREGLEVLKGMQQNRTAIYLGVDEPITTPYFHTCCGNKSKDIKLLPLTILSKCSNSSSSLRCIFKHVHLNTIQPKY